MKPDQYNPKAREAFARSLIDIGVSIFKSLILLFTVVPVVAIFKGAFSGKDGASIVKQLLTLPGGSQALILVFVILAFLTGHHFRKEGLRHLHEAEDSGR